MWSDACGLEELLLPYALDPQTAGLLDCVGDWSRRWTASWKSGRTEVVCPVRDLAGVPAQATRPVRAFSFRAGQRHRPGLQYLVSTGRMHGFESLAERRLLVALDFVAGAGEVLAQPFRLSFEAEAGRVEHTPDFLALVGGAGVLIDVRPADRIKAEDALKFAASARAAAAVGWRYIVATGWRAQVWTGLDALSARRRPMPDPLGLQDGMLQAVAERPRRLLDLVDASGLPAVARPHLMHLLWRRQLAVDLARPLGDGSWIYPGAGG